MFFNVGCVGHINEAKFQTLRTFFDGVKQTESADAAEPLAMQKHLAIKRPVQSPKLVSLANPSVVTNLPLKGEIPNPPEPVFQKPSKKSFTRLVAIGGILGLGLGIGFKMVGFFASLGTGVVVTAIIAAVFAAIGAGLSNNRYIKIKGRVVERKGDPTLELTSGSHEHMNRIIDDKRPTKPSKALPGEDPGNTSKGPFTIFKKGGVDVASTPIEKTYLKL